jgi:predicted amidohydrolase YtcJ
MTVAAPDLIVHGAIATLAGDRGLGWVDAIAIAAGRVVAAGTRSDVDGLAERRTRQLELSPDEAALPALTDAHLHLAEGGLSAERIDLTTSTSMADALARIREADQRLPEDAWLEGHGWDADRLGEWPTAAAMASIAPGRRGAIWAHDHHSLWVSEAALEAAGIRDDTPDPPGGLIRRDGHHSARGRRRRRTRDRRSRPPPRRARRRGRARSRRALPAAGPGAHRGRLSPVVRSRRPPAARPRFRA